MRTVGVFEAKTHLSRLLEDVAKGETIAITKHGVPVAILTPPPVARRPDLRAAVEAVRQFQRETHLSTGGLAIREMIEEGRR